MTQDADSPRLWRLIPGLAIGAAVALLFAAVAVTVYNERAYRSQKTAESEVQARILAGSVTAALAFDDSDTAQEYVDALQANPEIVSVIVYDLRGDIVARYARRGRTMAGRAAAGQPEAGDEGDAASYVTVTAPVVQGGGTIGSVELRAALEPFARRIERYAAIGLPAGMAALLVGVLGIAHSALSRSNAELRRQIAERRKAEEALRQSQKMEAIGQLSGGVAHDFNNLLQAMSACLRMIERRSPAPEIAPLIEAGRQAVDRGAKLTQQLMAFARRQALRPEPVDVAEVLLGMSELLSRALRADIRFEVDLERGLWPIEVDPTQFELAVINLAVNARDAMPEGGSFRIRGWNAVLEPGGDTHGLAGDHVHIAASDDGQGMPPEVLERVFEPFFTTKGVGKGTGLGLSQVYGFARQSGGQVRIASTPGTGTTVTLVLPRSARAPQKRLPEVVEAARPGGGRRLMLVEDDPVVGPVMATTIEDLGYCVVRASSADEALALLSGGERVDVLLSDIVMPGARNGVDLGREVRRLYPGLPVVLTSGYSENPAAGCEFVILAKPCPVELLAETLAKAIGEAPMQPDAPASASRLSV
ncbi:ATP-binding protein [Arenibaculum pallidiluteum]|uniref:ATP-binding protein n=1 Tax=Arenibaculum pallidiluteum TaxID=2812559 RepID=UPI001F255415|nr:ATP-binding protein [Arenibaculum pallidiluteum]